MRPVIDLGNVQVFNADGGRFLLDAGAMTGMVPKALWHKEIETDELDRMQLGSNVAVIRAGDRVILTDTGPGAKLDEKMKRVYAIDEVDLRNTVAAFGVKPEDVTDIVPTHLHFDHCGALTIWAEPARAVPAFPNAVVHVQALEWKAAVAPNALTRRTYLPENFLPISEAGLLNLVEGYVEVAPGVEVFRTGGHSDGHQAIRVEGSDGVMYHMGDLLADIPHLHVPWLMSYDRDAYVSLQAKERFMKRAWKEDAAVWLGHDHATVAVRIRPDDKKPLYHHEVIAVSGKA